MATGDNNAAINKALNPILKKINNDNVRLNEAESKVNVKIMEETVDAVIKAMRKVDPLFDEMFQRKVYTGSYYDGLRVKSPTEFDLNIVIRLPFKAEDVTIISAQNAPAFMQYRLKRSLSDILSINNPKWTTALHQYLRHFLDKNHTLLRTEIQRWIQGIIAKAIESSHFRKPASVKSLQPSQSGPAFTYYINTNTGVKIDVDLVPVIDGTPYPIPSSINKSKRFKALPQQAQETWFLVPKPYTGPSVNMNVDTLWRISFPEAEKQLLQIQGCVKMQIKLFKLLRDRENWKKIASYYIKTLFLLEMDVTEKTAWGEVDSGILFMKMLKKLKMAVEQRSLSYYFNRKCNLLSGLDRAIADNISRRMGVIIADVEKTPQSLARYYPSSA